MRRWAGLTPFDFVATLGRFSYIMSLAFKTFQTLAACWTSRSKNCVLFGRLRTCGSSMYFSL